MLFKLLSFGALAIVASAASLSSVLSSDAGLSSLNTIISNNPELVKTLDAAQKITVLAPSNDAFAKYLKTEVGKAVAADADALQNLLTYHVLNSVVKAADFTNTPAFVPTLLTSEVYTNVTGGQVVEGFLKEKTIDIISGLQEISKVERGDIQFDGGIIHVIDTVLTVPSDVSDTATFDGLTDLVSALATADLVADVNWTQDLTIFAPTNAAFRKLGPAAANLTVEQLSNILGYHVVAATSVLYSTELQDGDSVKTTQGQSVKISIQNGNIFVNNAKVIQPDVLVANGVVHIIDGVLLPTANSTGTTTATATATAAPSASATGSGSGSGSGTGTGGLGSGTAGGSSPSTSPIAPFNGASSTKMLSSLGYSAAVLSAFFFLL